MTAMENLLASPTFLALLAVVLLLVIALIVVARHGASWLRSSLIWLSHSKTARRFVTAMPLARRVASRFVAGSTRDDAIAVTKELNRAGFLVTLDFLGESVTSATEASAACAEIMALLDCIEENQLDANVSIKPTQLGLQLDESLAHANLLAITRHAATYGNFIRMDMEDSASVDATLRVFRSLRHEHGLENVGVVIQSYLYRSEEDVAALAADGVRVRLCKGAYAEPEDVAFPDKADTDDNYIRLAETLLSESALQNGSYPAFATHDARLVALVQSYCQENRLSRTDYEFQMLYGIRRDLQESLLNDGHRVRIYVPYGEAWYPYFVRRLAERPANLWFFVSNFFRA